MSHAAHRFHAFRQRFACQRAGLTLNELVFAAALFTLVLLTALSMFARDVDLGRSANGAAQAETRAQALLHKIGSELADAVGATPVTVLVETLSGGEQGSAVVGSTAGFPASGRLLIDRGPGNSVERCDYAALGVDGASFGNLTRGVQCTAPNQHAAGAEVRWAALAEALPAASQAAPPAGSFDGRAIVLGRTVAFSGDGTGFSFRVPVDPSNSVPPDYMLDGQVQWGARVAGVPTTNGFASIEFVPRTTIDEALIGRDLNGDGDLLDVFDVGQLRRRTWDVSAPELGEDIGIGPTIVLQEQCAWGSDLDGDGFEDPIFLWDPERRELALRLFVINESVRGLPIVRRVEALFYLRNPEP